MTSPMKVYIIQSCLYYISHVISMSSKLVVPSFMSITALQDTETHKPGK